MNNSKILFCAATQGKKEDTVLYKSIKQGYFIGAGDIQFKENNVESLQKAYNEFIDFARKEGYETLILVHDDVYINCSDIFERVNKIKEQYTVFGLAGCTTATVREPALWHLMSKREDWRGCVAHGTKDQYYYTSFGPIPSRALLIDGVFMGINLKKLPDNVRFDETYPSRFHYYDLDFALECNKNKVSVGVVDIPIIHQSPGLTNPNEEFYAGQEYFINKWKK